MHEYIALDKVTDKTEIISYRKDTGFDHLFILCAILILLYELTPYFNQVFA